jgi:hypothetical protein
LRLNAAIMADLEENMEPEEDEQAGGDERGQAGEQQLSQPPPTQPPPSSQPVVPQPGAATTTQGRKSAKKPEYPCLTCGKNVTSNAVECTSCAQWCHRPCSGLSNEAFKALDIQKKEVGVAFWGCRSFMAFNVKVNSQLQEAMRRQDLVEEKVERYARNTEQVSNKVDRLEQNSAGSE